LAQIVPFNNGSDYHDKCQITDFNNATNVEHCRLANLPVSCRMLGPRSPSLHLTHLHSQDLNQDDAFVRSTLLQWAATLSAFGFDGLRIDTVPEVKPAFWAEFTAAAGMYTVGDVTPAPPATKPVAASSCFRSCEFETRILYCRRSF
jgi:alpha-amylase